MEGICGTLPGAGFRTFSWNTLRPAPIRRQCFARIARTSRPTNVLRDSDVNESITGSKIRTNTVHITSLTCGPRHQAGSAEDANAGRTIARDEGLHAACQINRARSTLRQRKRGPLCRLTHPNLDHIVFNVCGRCSGGGRVKYFPYAALATLRPLISWSRAHKKTIERGEMP